MLKTHRTKLNLPLSTQEMGGIQQRSLCAKLRFHQLSRYETPKFSEEDATFEISSKITGQNLLNKNQNVMNYIHHDTIISSNIIELNHVSYTYILFGTICFQRKCIINKNVSICINFNYNCCRSQFIFIRIMFHLRKFLLNIQKIFLFND